MIVEQQAQCLEVFIAEILRFVDREHEVALLENRRLEEEILECILERGAGARWKGEAEDSADGNQEFDLSRERGVEDLGQHDPVIGEELLLERAAQAGLPRPGIAENHGQPTRRVDRSEETVLCLSQSAELAIEKWVGGIQERVTFEAEEFKVP